MSGGKNPAYRQYLRRIVAATALYVVSIILAASLIGDRAVVSPLAVVLALAPGLAILLMIFAMGRLLTELNDEFLRLLEVRKALIATALTLAIAGTWGLLEMFTAVPRLGVFWIFPIWCAGLGVGALANRITHGTGGLM